MLKSKITQIGIGIFVPLIAMSYVSVSHAAGNGKLEFSSTNDQLTNHKSGKISATQTTAGGFVLFGKVQGEIAAKQALKILSGTAPNKIKPIIPENGRFLFSKAQLAKWNLSLPKNIEKDSEYTQ